jgi:N-acetylglucosaminyldiphosphoundecaprenol N-acetyl-beta-D-mannosaminyltransferase
MIAWVRRRYKIFLLLLPLLILSAVITDQRFWGLVLGLSILIVGSFLKKSLKLSPWFDLAFLGIAGLASYACGFRVHFLTNLEGGFVYLTALSLPLTLAWIVAVTQSVHFMGTIDSSGKLIGKTVLLTSFAFLIIDILQGQSLGFAISLVLVILALTMALMHYGINLSRFSRALGFGLALVSIAGLLKTTATLALLTPLAVFGLPMVTTSLAFVAGRAPAQHAWLEFFSQRGFSISSALFVVYLASSLLSISLALTAPLENSIITGVCVSLIVLGMFLIFTQERWLLGGFESDERRLKLFGTPVDRVTLCEATHTLEKLAQFGHGALIVTPDTTALMRAQRDAKLRKIYECAALVTPDGSGLVMASRLLKRPLRERVSGIDLLHQFFARAAIQHHKIFLLGAAPGIADAAAQKLRESFPGLQIVGTQHGYFSEAENKSVITKIRHTQPDLVLVALGVPRQEYWMAAHREALGVKALMGVGGSLDVFAGRVKRAPQIWQKLGLEWAYRALKQPWRLWRVRVIPLFLSKVLLLKLVRALSA